MDMLAEVLTADPAFRADVLAGLSAKIRAIPARWLYDARGSELFEAITELPEYYPTRVETGLLQRHSRDVAGIVGEDLAVIEFGSGSSTKTPLLLNAVKPAAYVPIDISAAALEGALVGLIERFPALPIHPVEGDFMRRLALPAAVADRPKLGFFPGSTIGNMVPWTAVDLLRAMRETLGDETWLLIGMDRIKKVSTLTAAYDDAQGVTAAFNLNLLDRINRELAGTIRTEDFRHLVRWNEAWARIEMHLEAVRDTDFTVAGQSFSMQAGETIHTENSHKYGPRSGRMMLLSGGWTVTNEWTDDNERFSILLARAEAPRSAP